jgi:N-acetylglucosaminyldiphosphoundecaprenol N-acetyl-beta-D-mannosaminyltransferase
VSVQSSRRHAAEYRASDRQRGVAGGEYNRPVRRSRASTVGFRRSRTLAPGAEVDARIDGTLRSFDMLGLPLLSGSLEAAAEWLVRCRRDPHGRAAVVVHVNVNTYFRLRKQPLLLTELQDGAGLFFEGIGMKLGALFIGRGWAPDVNGSDLFPVFMRRSSRAPLPLYLLGGRDEVVTRACAAVRSRYGGGSVVGCRSGYFSDAEEGEIVEAVRASGARVLLIGRGSPLQETFALRHRAAFGVDLIWNVGGLFDFLSGVKPRAPLPLRRARLEWLFRLWIEPRRLAGRYLLLGPWFLVELVRRGRRPALGRGN